MKKEIIETIAGWTQVEAEKGNMLAKTSEEISGELNAGDGVIVTDETGQAVAYGRLKQWPEAGAELGSLVVDPARRHEGWGVKAVEQLADMVNGRGAKGFFCLAENDVSAKLFGKKLGAPQMDKNQLPSEVWELCFAPSRCKHADIFPNCPCKAYNLEGLKMRK
jgi:N-acetylglutamate synthase-like GNAT family acetyltransferase